MDSIPAATSEHTTTGYTTTDERRAPRDNPRPAAAATVAAYASPKRPRRAYGDTRVAGTATPRRAEPGRPVAVTQLVDAMLRSHALDWARTQRDNCRIYLLSPHRPLPAVV